MKINYDNKKIIEGIKDSGYFILENFLSKEDLEKIKNSLLATLNYIKPSNETDLQKKFCEIKVED